jgi:hypothetical protein
LPGCSFYQTVAKAPLFQIHQFRERKKALFGRLVSSAGFGGGVDTFAVIGARLP